MGSAPNAVIDRLSLVSAERTFGGSVSAPVLQPDSPLSARLRGYLDERFPLGAYGVLVATFFGSALLVALDLASAPFEMQALVGAPVVLLVFFHLRVFDEHKDAASDRAHYPDRLLTRGVVTLPLLRRVGVVAILAELVLSGLVGGPALMAWAATLTFTLAMAVEFGVGSLLQPRMVLYAVTHNPVVAGLCLFAWACSGAAWEVHFLAYVLFASASSLGFELGRKLRQPHEELAGVPSYSSVLGLDRARRLLFGVWLVADVGAGWTWGQLSSTGVQRWLAMGVLVVMVVLPMALCSREAGAKRMELAATLHLLLGFLALGLAAW